MSRWWPFLNTILFKTQWHLTRRNFLCSRILPTALSRIPRGMLNGTRCPKSQPAILDQTIFKLRIFTLKTFSYKVQCSKGIIFTVIASTQTRGSVLHLHRLDKIWLSLYLKKIITLTGNTLTTANPRQPATPHSTKATTGSHEAKELCPYKQVFTQWALLKWHQIFAVKILKTYIRILSFKR